MKDNYLNKLNQIEQLIKALDLDKETENKNLNLLADIAYQVNSIFKSYDSLSAEHKALKTKYESLLNRFELLKGRFADFIESL